MLTLRIALTTLFAAISFSLGAQSYPLRPVRIIVATGVGVSDDVSSRVIAERMSTLLSQKVIVENRPGAGGLIAQNTVLKATPNGYTLLYAGGSMAGARFANAAVTYDLLRDFTPISLVGESPFALGANPTLPARDIKEFIALAKSRPNKLTYGTIGAGQMPYWSVMLFNAMTGIQALDVPFKATPEVLTDIVAGRIDYYITGLTPLLPLKDRLRILAVTTRARTPQLPDIPTLIETGLANYDMPGWGSIMGPAGMQREPVEILSKAIHQTLATPDVRERFEKVGTTAMSSTPAELRKRYELWIGIFGKIAKDVGLKPQ